MYILFDNTSISNSISVSSTIFHTTTSVFSRLEVVVLYESTLH